MIKHHGTHPYQCTIFNSGAMDHHVVPDRDIITNDGYRFLIECVNNGAILNVDSVADTDGVDITPQHGIEPDAAVVTDDHITNDCGVVGQIIVFSHLRGKAPDRFDQCHS